MLGRVFRRDQSGGVALTFAIGAVMLVLAVGGGVDLSREVSLREELADAVDSAAIGAVSGGSPAAVAARSMVGDGPILAGQDEVRHVFDANVPAPSPMTIESFTANVDKKGLAISASVTATASVPTLFMGLIGIPKLTSTAHSASASNLPAFVDYYLLLDNSPSMGIGATDADMTMLAANTPGSCAFACHDLSNPNNNYLKAKSLGVTTRMDVLRSATQQLFSTAGATEIVPNQFRMGLYSFGVAAETLGFTPVFPPTADLDAGRTAAASIDLMTVPNDTFNNDQDTDFNAALDGANAVIDNPGDGTSAETPQKVLFFVSDGVNDSNRGGTRTITTVDPAECQKLKDRGIKIAVLYTTYLPLTGKYLNQFYHDRVAPFHDQIGPTMQACASDGLYFEVSPTDGIAEAMAALFQKTVLQARITH